MRKNEIKQYYSDRIGGPIDLCSAILTAIVLGLFLSCHEDYLLSKEITKTASIVCFGVADIMLIYLGYKLKKKFCILGISEMGVSSFMTFVYSKFFFSNGDAFLRVVLIIVYAFFLFVLIGGIIAFFCSIIKKDENDMKKAESTVVIITSMLTVAISLIELFY